MLQENILKEAHQRIIQSAMPNEHSAVVQVILYVC